MARWALDIGASKTVLGQRDGTGVRVVARTATPDRPERLIAWLSKYGFGRVGLGVAFPGGIDADGRVTRWPNRPGWDGFLLVAALGALADAVFVVDDGMSAALGETRLGVARGHRDVLVAVLGTGLGGALVIGDRVRPVSRSDPRTLGHVRIFDGPRCGCGGTGCAQTALATLPADDQLGTQLSGWARGERMADFLADLARFAGIETIVATGGRLSRPVLRAQLIGRLATAGLEPLVPDDPAVSSLLGASVVGL